MTAWKAELLRLMRWREAIASVALSHGPKCDCAVCAAATGDDEAFARIVQVLEAAEGKRNGR